MRAAGYVPPPTRLWTPLPAPAAPSTPPLPPATPSISHTPPPSRRRPRRLSRGPPRPFRIPPPQVVGDLLRRHLGPREVDPLHDAQARAAGLDQALPRGGRDGGA